MREGTEGHWRLFRYQRHNWTARCSCAANDRRQLLSRRRVLVALRGPNARRTLALRRAGGSRRAYLLDVAPPQPPAPPKPPPPLPPVAKLPSPTVESDPHQPSTAPPP